MEAEKREDDHQPFKETLLNSISISGGELTCKKKKKSSAMLTCCIHSNCCQGRVAMVTGSSGLQGEESVPVAGVL